MDDESIPSREIMRRYRAGQRDFRGLDIADVGERAFRGATLDGANLAMAFIVADFTGASLRDTSFVDANVKTCVFDGADLSGADFRRAALCATTWVGTALSSAVFDGASRHGHEFGPGEKPT